MRVVDGHIEGYVEMKPDLIGNLAFQVLHGGVAATLLDSIGGIVAMEHLYVAQRRKPCLKPLNRLHAWRPSICV
ncbi:hypothetical protein J514_1436 [Acinetobacter sp. 1396970]|nr:hypothetical protein J514_1436 [Acinetobacter sp. 1396970]